MACDDYRIVMMALLDGEIEQEEQTAVEQHVRSCRRCRSEYAQLQELNALTSRMRFIKPQEAVWAHYYSGVCRKIEARGGWALWSAGALLLVTTGVLMMFGCPGNGLAAALGVISMLAGVSLLWLSYFCNCKS